MAIGSVMYLVMRHVLLNEVKEAGRGKIKQMRVDRQVMCCPYFGTFNLDGTQHSVIGQNERSRFVRSIYVCRVHHRATALDVFNKWHVAFHGTRVDSVNAILECGDLLIPGISFSI